MICSEGGRAGTRRVWTRGVALVRGCRFFGLKGKEVYVRSGAVQALLLKKEKYKS